ncbi:MAG: glycine cleavage system protein GcvH [Dehalococcoidia bacterium]
MNPTDRKYSREHEWVLLESKSVALVGITDFAQDQLGDIVYFELPQPGTKVQQHQKIGEVESVKSVSDILCPVNGEVVEVNQGALDRPETVNEDAYTKGWLLRISLSNPRELDALLSASEYEAYIAEQG